jgi:hypothetical protein
LRRSGFDWVDTAAAEATLDSSCGRARDLHAAIKDPRTEERKEQGDSAKQKKGPKVNDAAENEDTNQEDRVESDQPTPLPSLGRRHVATPRESISEPDRLEHRNETPAIIG